MEYLKDDCIDKLLNESMKRRSRAAKKNNEKAVEHEDAYQQALYDVLDWVNDNKEDVEVIGGELEMVAV